MKTAKDRAREAVAAMSQFHITVDPVLTSGKTLLETLFEEAEIETLKWTMSKLANPEPLAKIVKRLEELGWAIYELENGWVVHKLEQPPKNHGE